MVRGSQTESRNVALDATTAFGGSGQIASDAACSAPATLCCQERGAGSAVFKLRTQADSHNSICFGGSRCGAYLRRKDFPLPVIPRINVWATSPLCRFRKYGVLLSVSSTARYSVPR